MGDCVVAVRVVTGAAFVVTAVVGTVVGTVVGAVVGVVVGSAYLHKNITFVV